MGVLSPCLTRGGEGDFVEPLNFTRTAASRAGDSGEFYYRSASVGPMPLTLVAERREPSGEARENSAKPDGLRSMPLTLVAERREPSGEAQENSAKPDGLRRSATINSPKSVALGEYCWITEYCRITVSGRVRFD